MARFAGIKNSTIRVISDKTFSCEGLEVIAVPAELINVSSQNLIANYKVINNTFKSKLNKKQAKDMKVALVTNWAMACGLASYAKSLYSELIKNIGDYKFFIEDNNPTEPLYNTTDSIIPQDKLTVCWKRGNSLSNLIQQIKEYDPDIILINHEFGLWPNACHWISMMNQLSDYRIIVTMHSVFHHKDKTIVESCMPEIIVHLDGAKQVLKEEKQISANVHVIPHGCEPCIDKSKFWNFYKTEHTFLQFGYIFKYKAFENCIKAAHILKQKYPDIFFTGLCSESPYAKVEHTLYYNELMDLIDNLDLKENVGLIRGYQSDEVLNSYLRTNKAAVFPYILNNKEDECFGSSGASPLAMSKSIPVITSAAHHFATLPSIKADSPEQIAEELDKLFSNKKYVQEQLEKQYKYLEENSWGNIAKQYIKVFEDK